MGIESYNFILFPERDRLVVSSDGWMVLGNYTINMDRLIPFLLTHDHIQVSPLHKGQSFYNEDCYYDYINDDTIIEIEINGGESIEDVKYISVRFALPNPKITYDKAIDLCEQMAKHLNLSIHDLCACTFIPITNDNSRQVSYACYEDKRDILYGMFGIPSNIEFIKIRCGSEAIEKMLSYKTRH